MRKRASVVVIDDDAEFRETLCDVVAREGGRALAFDDARQALRYLERNGAALVFLDLQMPGTDGWLALREMKQSPALRRLPVVVISAAQRQSAMMLGAGVECYLEKPVSLADVAALVGRFLPPRAVG